MEWNDSLSTGNELIDRQHRSLIECVTEFKKTGARGGVLKSAMAMDALRTYVSVHFGTEEDLMRQYDYPRLAEHAAEHRAFVDRLDALMKENVFRNNSADLAAFFEHWLENHLLQSDMDYVPFLSGKKTES